MPILVLLIPLARGRRARRYVGSRYPTPVVGQAPADKPPEKIEMEMEEHPWLLRLVYERLDPATATGLALTLALGLAIVGGLLVGLLAYLVRSNDSLVDADFSVGEWGVDNATSWSTDALQFSDRSRRHVRHRRGARARLTVRIPPGPDKSVPPFLLTVVVGGDPAGQHHQGDTGPRPPDLQSDRGDTSAVLPERTLGLGGSVLRGGCARARPPPRPRTRALLAGGAVAIAMGVACSRVLLGVHWMSDVIAGLAFGWAWFGICAIAFGGRFLVLGAPVEQAAEVATDKVPASERPVSASSGQTS